MSNWRLCGFGVGLDLELQGVERLFDWNSLQGFAMTILGTFSSLSNVADADLERALKVVLEEMEVLDALTNDLANLAKGGSD